MLPCQDRVSPRIFISHSWDHPDQHDRLIGLLDRKGYDFYDHSITMDQPLPVISMERLKADLSERISRVSCVVFLATDDAHKKSVVKYEVEEALRQRKRVIGIKPFGSARGPIPKLMDEYADAIVGFRTDQIISAIEGENIRNMSVYQIAEDEDLYNLAHWILRASSGVILAASVTGSSWLPQLNALLRQWGIQVVVQGPAPTFGQHIKRILIGAGIWSALGLLFKDRRMILTLAAAGSAVGAGSFFTGQFPFRRRQILAD